MAKLFLALALFGAIEHDGEWHRWFAWYPVTVDAYDASEIENGKMSYTRWLTFVDYRWYRWTDNYVDGSPEVHELWRYRLAK